MATNVLTQNGALFKMDASLASKSDICPVCKSTAQTSPNLRFKVSAKCYHRICEGCVDRKFSAGKAQCPISACTHMLWKRDWRLQTFEDLQVEREVDIRRKVWKTLDLASIGLVEDPKNGWETAFEDLRSYNDYLELKEELAMNLIYNTDVQATNKKLSDYEIANGLRKEKDDPKAQSQAKTTTKPGDYPDASGMIKGLRTKYVPPPRSPYNAFHDTPKDRDYYDLSFGYERTLDKHVRNKDYEASGYSYEAFMDESLLAAFSGLGVFIGTEMGKDTDMAMPLANGADVKSMDDVF